MIVTDWILNHPEVMVTIALAVITFLGKPRTPEEYAAMNPVLAKIMVVMAALGPDLSKAIKLLTTPKDPDAKS